MLSIGTDIEHLKVIQLQMVSMKLLACSLFLIFYVIVIKKNPHVTINFECQFDWIKNHRGHWWGIPVGVSVKASPEKIKFGVKTDVGSSTPRLIMNGRGNIPLISLISPGVSKFLWPQANVAPVTTLKKKKWHDCLEVWWKWRFIVDMRKSPARGFWKGPDWTGPWQEMGRGREEQGVKKPAKWLGYRRKEDSGIRDWRC